VQAVVYDKEMLASLDGILRCAAEVLEKARKSMAVAGDMPSDDVDTLLAMRDEMAMRLARYDGDPEQGSKGIYLPPDQLLMVADIEDDATDILDALGHDQPDYECPEFRRHRERAIQALLKSGTR
jgi:hypothetical protein